jgi:hypothetical protein
LTAANVSIRRIKRERSLVIGEGVVGEAEVRVNSMWNERATSKSMKIVYIRFEGTAFCGFSLSKYPYRSNKDTHSKYSKYESPLDPSRIGEITKLPSAGLEKKSESTQRLNEDG